MFCFISILGFITCSSKQYPSVVQLQLATTMFLRTYMTLGDKKSNIFMKYSGCMPLRKCLKIRCQEIEFGGILANKITFNKLTKVSSKCHSYNNAKWTLT